MFAIVPLRNILPGAPPPGSWIDQALVRWVLLALATAMALYIYAWVRQGTDATLGVTLARNLALSRSSPRL